MELSTEDSEEIADATPSQCNSPTLKLMSNDASFRAMIESHAWKVDHAERFGNDAFLSKIHCVNCGLERMSIFSAVTEGAKTKSQKK